MDPSILLFFSVVAMTVASPTGSAGQTAALTAYAKETGIDQMLQDLEKKHIPKQVEIYFGNAVVITQVIFERKVQFKWTF